MILLPYLRRRRFCPATALVRLRLVVSIFSCVVFCACPFSLAAQNAVQDSLKLALREREARKLKDTATVNLLNALSKELSRSRADESFQRVTV
jgi:hypothetical protein